jgi:hypothetical protein
MGQRFGYDLDLLRRVSGERPDGDGERTRTAVPRSWVGTTLMAKDVVGG